VQFGLQFEPSETLVEAPQRSCLTFLLLRPARRCAGARRRKARTEPAKTSEGAEVVRLDRFRKK
jgi:hypothetical protein